MPIVATVDQQGSRSQRDRVGEAIQALAGLSVLRPFERTAGDELQGVLADGQQAVDVVLALTRLGGFHIGLGIGEVEEPLPQSTREGRGRAYERARAAVERAKRRPGRLAVEADDRDRTLDAQTALDVLAALRSRRSEAAWEALALVERGASTTAAAAELGVTRQAVQQRLSAAQWGLEVEVRRLAVRLLNAAVGASAASDTQQHHRAGRPEGRGRR